LTILATLVEEIAIAVFVLWGLPKLGIHIPLPVFIAIMAGLGIYAVISYRVGSRVLRKKPIVGLPAMVGSKGKVESPLAPEGLIKIKDELWEAKSASGRIDTGEEVIVVGQDGLKLVVCRGSDLKEIK